MKPRLRPIAILTALLLSSLGTAAQNEPIDDTDPARIARRIVNAYQSLNSYADTGSAVIRHTRSDNPMEERIEFNTLYQRPQQFRFEWTRSPDRWTSGGRFVVGSDGDEVWSDYPWRNGQRVQERHLAAAVGGATGISSDTVTTISAMLINGAWGFRPERLLEPAVSGRELVDGVECIVLTGKDSAGRDNRIWVGAKDYLIRRKETEHDAHLHIETRRITAVDVPIPKERFIR